MIPCQFRTTVFLVWLWKKKKKKIVIAICRIWGSGGRGSQRCVTTSNNEICPSRLESGLTVCLIKEVWGKRGRRDLAAGSVYLCVIGVSLRFIPRLPRAAAARPAVSCGLWGVKALFSAQPPGQVWGGLRPESRLAGGEGVRGLSKKLQRGLKKYWSQTREQLQQGEAMIHRAPISPQRCGAFFLFIELYCHLLIRLMDYKSPLLLFLHYNQLISSLFPFHFLVFFFFSFCPLSLSLSLCLSLPPSDILRCGKFKALMMGKLSQNADPPKQLDSVSEKGFRVLVLQNTSILSSCNLQMSTKEGRQVVCVVWKGVRSNPGWLLYCLVLLYTSSSRPVSSSPGLNWKAAIAVEVGETKEVLQTFFFFCSPRL